MDRIRSLPTETFRSYKSTGRGNAASKSFRLSDFATVKSSRIMSAPPIIKFSHSADHSASSSTTQLSFDDFVGVSSFSSQTMAGAQSVTKKGTPATVMTTPSTVGSSDIESGLSRLRELEQKRLLLRQQRFSLEQRLYEFCGNLADSPVTGGQRVENVSFEFYSYTGPLNDASEPHGSHARLEFFDGQVYEGSVEHGLRAGHGRNVWKDGQLYVGEWRKNSRNGRGTHQWPDGRKACGTWKDGHLHGKVGK